LNIIFATLPKIGRVCEGKYAGSEIVVDHLMMLGRELKGLKVGDVVCVTLEKRKTLSTVALQELL
jgi:transcription elongation GreA/GreB family factor